MNWVYLHLIAVPHVHWTISSKNLHLKANFLFQSFLVITVVLEMDFQNMIQNLSENDEMRAIFWKYVIEQKTLE